LWQCLRSPSDTVTSIVSFDIWVMSARAVSGSGLGNTKISFAIVVKMALLCACRGAFKSHHSQIPGRPPPNSWGPPPELLGTVPRTPGCPPELLGAPRTPSLPRTPVCPPPNSWVPSPELLGTLPRTPGCPPPNS